VTGSDGDGNGDGDGDGYNANQGGGNSTVVPTVQTLVLSGRARSVLAQFVLQLTVPVEACAFIR